MTLYIQCQHPISFYFFHSWSYQFLKCVSLLPQIFFPVDAFIFLCCFCIYLWRLKKNNNFASTSAELFLFFLSFFPTEFHFWQILKTEFHNFVAWVGYQQHSELWKLVLQKAEFWRKYSALLLLHYLLNTIEKKNPKMCNRLNKCVYGHINAILLQSVLCYLIFSTNTKGKLRTVSIAGSCVFPSGECTCIST